MDFHHIESPQVSDGQTPKGMSSCPERGIGPRTTTKVSVNPASWIVKPPLIHYGLTNMKYL